MKWILMLLLIVNTSLSQAQDIPSTPEEIENQYNINIRKARINGVYIPKDIHEAIAEIIELSPVESLDKFKKAEESYVVKRLHFGLGKWIASKWNFHSGSRYSHYLRMQGISFPDDMIDFTLTALHRHLNDKPLEIEKEVQQIVEIRRKEHQERKSRMEVIEKKEIKIDTTGGK